tara:strand:- start:897 stop:1028 length:132 start_codon:yes stop_codon:yes gene_type:complete
MTVKFVAKPFRFGKSYVLVIPKKNINTLVNPDKKQIVELVEVN